MTLPTPAAGHAPTRGALWMIGAGVCFAFGNSLLRYLTGVMHPYEVAFFQYGLALLILLPWVLVRGMASVRTGRPWLQALRVAAAAVGVLFLTLGFQKLPVVEVVALTFAAPLFAVVGAALVLKERVGWQRWMADGARLRRRADRPAAGPGGVPARRRPSPGRRLLLCRLLADGQAPGGDRDAGLNRILPAGADDTDAAGAGNPGVAGARARPAFRTCWLLG